MSPIGPARIKYLCQEWLRAATPEEGVIQIGDETESFRLLQNGVQFHELDHSELRAAALGLSTVLLRPGLNTIIHQDHQAFWSWCGELLCGSVSTYFGSDEQEIKSLMGLCVRASLAGIAQSREEAREEQLDISRRLEPNAKAWVRHSHEALAYLAFPLLEGLLKKHCREYVTMNGAVLQPFVVPGVKEGSV